MAESSGEMPVVRPAEKRAGWLTASVLWTVAIAIYVFLYLGLAARPTIAGVLATAGAVLALLVVTSGAIMIRALRRGRREYAAINHGVAALSRGQLDLANETFTRCAGSTNTFVAAVARHNLGWTLLRQGRLEASLAVLSNNDAVHEHALKRMLLHGTSSVDLALCCALLGKLEDAASWLSVTAQRAVIAAHPSLPAMTAFARAVLDCRDERWGDAARMLDEQWAECEATLTGSELRPLRVVRAYAHAAGGPREAGVADSVLAATRPVYDGELDFLGVAWPAMRMFLASHRLVRELANPAA